MFSPFSSSRFSAPPAPWRAGLGKLLWIGLWACSSLASAYTDDRFLLARDAFRAGDAARLERLAPELQGSDLGPYVDYYRLRIHLDQTDPAAIVDFLNRQDKTYLAEKLRGDWLRFLAKQQRWQEFDAEFPKVSQPDQDLACYALQGRIQRGDSRALDEALPLWRSLMDPPPPCVPVLEALVLNKRVLAADVWDRIHLQFEANKTAQAWNTVQYLPVSQAPDSRTYAQVVDKPLIWLYQLPPSFAANRQVRELALLALQRVARNDPAVAKDRLEKLQDQFQANDLHWIWGEVAWQAATRHFGDALNWYKRAGDGVLSDEPQAWRVRAALRAQDWGAVRDGVEAMRPPQSDDPTWIYWLGRAYKAGGVVDKANRLFQRIAGQANFYGSLASEELGRPVRVPPAAKAPTPEEMARVSNNVSVRRALALFSLNLRFEGSKEWSWALKGMSDRELLAAAEIAKNNNIFDRAIAAADKTRNEHDYSLRYLAPYVDQVRPAARSQQLDDAWVYGLMRQESRFVTSAKSNVGASGLMQLMPATARWVAKKIGLRDYSPNQVADTETNLMLGTSYLRLVMESLDNHPVLASAAYNAGPGRAQKWRGSQPLEGAIYAETIPFAETRDYVKKVMSNSIYYSILFNDQPQSLKQRLGVVMPKGSSFGAVSPSSLP